MSTAASEELLVLAGGRMVRLVLRRHPRSRGYRLRLDRTGVARLTLPVRASAQRAVAWAREQGPWIAAELDRLTSRDCVLADGARFTLEGAPVTIAWAEGASRSVTREGDRLLLGGPRDRAGERVLRWLKALAADTLTKETRALADRHGLALRSVAVGDPTSRWGSCTASGAIRYSWRLILAPPEIRIATVAHEVAHLRHLDHSAAFHAFHRAICPSDTVAARAWLRAHGAALHRVRA